MKEQNVYNLMINVLAELVRTNKISMEDISIAVTSLRTKRIQDNYHFYLRSDYEEYIKPIPENEEIAKIIKNIPITEEKNYIYPRAARYMQPIVDQTSTQMPKSSYQQLEEYLDKMTCPSAAQLSQPAAAQPSDLEGHKPKNK